MKKIYLVFAFTYFLLFTNSFAQENNPKMSYMWSAPWINHPTASEVDYGVFHFRKTFELSEKPEDFVVYVSGDNRYRLFVNGEPVGMGPARGDLSNWRYETYDITSKLKLGKNVLAALVVNFGDKAQVAQISAGTGFLLQAKHKEHAVVNTGKSWKTIQNVGHTAIAHQSQTGYYACGPTDRVNGGFYPWGWEKPGFDDSKWMQAKEAGPATGRGYIFGNSRFLVPRTIPQLEEKVERFAKIARSAGIKSDEGFLKGEGTLIIPTRSRVTLLLDMGVETVGYPELLVSKGKDSEIKVTYAEALYDENQQKGNRNEVKGRKIIGYHDAFLPDGGEDRMFRPLWLRTFRYVQLDIETTSEALHIKDYKHIFTAYPFEQNAQFESGDNTLGDIWKVGWRTARLCATESYTDCPYYEQLNYIGDTRIQALVSLYVSGDDRLMRDAIRHFDNSRQPNGLTLSRYPSEIKQLIPPYSLFWIAMLHDYHRYRNDPAFVEEHLHGIAGVLEWFERHLNEENLLGALPWWQFTDWSKEFESGVPKGAATGNSANLSLQYVYTLQLAADLYKAYGKEADAEHWLSVASKIKTAVLEKCYDSKRGLIAETPEKMQFSQHSNIMAVLTNTIPEGKQQALMEKVLSEEDLIQTTLYFKFYLFRAMKKAGLADGYVRQLGKWRLMLSQGLTTFGETGEPHLQRSDCHAWSASPNFDFLNTICGIAPASAGFKTVEIAPSLGSLENVKGKMPHPLGDILVEFEKGNGDSISGQITLPQGLTGTFKWKGKTMSLKSGKQQVKL
ncbi:family 78 glycoside hydrolase catalytic domain [Flammeovirgaceae bacterium SG7u.111]|nr:family 78 glycoside hydrolase catalytic domain [Flammeovirgaceae bacterium SG7u.132]WPO34390.1 family 78 glycoside hydrolase catalytic domain [Flammeovirgaceae bacterium SG7u.111]